MTSQSSNNLYANFASTPPFELLGPGSPVVSLDQERSPRRGWRAAGCPARGGLG
ncbi:MAG: hypothetical protein MUO23_11740 [Anaerolineales bacterium]|nr:hypothetical protein [Anaerolineales bacterium]